MKKQKRLTKQPTLAGYTEREAWAAFDLYARDSFDQPDRPAEKFIRFVLNESGTKPKFVHAVPVKFEGVGPGDTLIELDYARGSSLPHPLSIAVRSEYAGIDSNFHVTFGNQGQAIVTELRPGEPLKPAQSPEADLRFAQDALNRVIEQKVSKVS